MSLRNRRKFIGRTLSLVELDRRDVPATFAVTTAADTVANDGALSLREAVIATNGSPGDDTVVLGLGAATYSLAIAGANEDAAATGDLDVTDATGTTTMAGFKASFTVVNAAGLDRVWDVHPGAKLTISETTSRGGDNVQNGGGIHNRGLLTLANAEVNFNRAVLRGGGIDNNATSAQIVMTGGKIAGNEAVAVTTAVSIGGGVSLGGGTATFTGAQFLGNKAAAEGGAISARSSTFSATDSFFAFNTANDGGAVATTGGNALFTNSQFSDNKALRGNTTAAGGRGGALLARGEVRVVRSTFNRNAASGINGQGAAIANTNFLEVINSTISNNVAGQSGANNPASNGGGIANLAGTLYLFSSTVTENVTRSGVAGGVHNAFPTTAAVTAFIQNTIVARNNVGFIASNAPDVAGAFTSSGGNLIGAVQGSSGWIASDLLGSVGAPIDPLLGLLGNNGGLSQTRPLLAGSPALDRGVPNAAIATDQRLQPRPAGAGVDIGAFEYQPTAVPTAGDDSYFTPEDTTYLAGIPGVQQNDIDPNGRPLTVQLVSNVSNGTLALAANGSFTYAPNANYHGPDSFVYRVFNDTGNSATATATFHVGAVNDAPTAADLDAATDEDTALTGTLPAVDVDGDALTYAAVDGPANGTVAVAADGSFTYAPNANFHGTDSFTFKANDGLLDSNVATVTVTVNSVNDAPVAAGQSASTDEDAALFGTLLGVDVDGDALAYALVGGAANGTVAVNADGSFAYSPNANFHGTDSFTFRANDGILDSNVATVSIAVAPVNDAPTLSPATFSLAENSPNGTGVGTIGGADVEGDALTYSIVGGNAGGAFVIDAATGAISVANGAALDFETTPTFLLTVRAQDAGGLSAQATATVNLTDVVEVPPVIIDIKPGDALNEIRLKSAKTVDVAILSSAVFDARTVDANSLRFGRTGAEDSLTRHKKTGAPQVSFQDVNGDGRLDLVARFVVADTGFRAGDTKGILTGRLANGPAFTDDDAVTVRN